MQRQDVVLAGLGGFALGLGVGAGLMFVLDPGSGRLGGAAHDLRNRARGLAATLRSRLVREDEVDAETLVARVRSQLGHLVRDPAQIEVTADGRCITLSGMVLADELDEVLDEVAAVRGVDEVYNLLQVQLPAPHVPGQH